MLSGMEPARRLMLMRRALLVATPFAIIGALYVSGKNQLLGLVLIAAFFLIAVRFARVQEKLEAQTKAPSEASPGTDPS